MVQRKTTTDNGGCCDPISDLQLEIDAVNQTAIDAKTTANTASGRIDSLNSAVSDLTESVAGFDEKISKNTSDITSLTARLDEDEPTIASNKTRITTAEGDISGLKTRMTDAEGDISALDATVKTAVKEVTVTQDASTVYHKAIKISGSTEIDALPVASRTQAGVMSASIYGGFEDQINNNSDRISVLESLGTVYDITGLVGTNPTTSEITAAFNSKYPGVTIIAGMRVSDYDNAHLWQYGNNEWIILTQVVIATATNTSLGTVKGSESTAGKVYVEADGSMSLNGYDGLVSKDSSQDGKITALESWRTTATSQIASLDADLTTAEGDIDTLESSVAGVASDVSTLSGKVTTNTSNISTLTSKVNTNTSSISSMQTSKQDKLIAGTNITIASDGKTISATGGSGTTYYAGDGIRISDGEISTIARDGVYENPFIAKVSSNSTFLTVWGTANPTCSPIFRCVKDGPVLAHVLGGTEVGENDVFLAIDYNGYEDVVLVIDLTSIVGEDLTCDHCTIIPVGLAKNGYYTDTLTDTTYVPQVLSGSIEEGIFTGIVSVGTSEGINYVIFADFLTESTVEEFNILIGSILIQ